VVIALVFDLPDRTNPDEFPARYQPQRIAATVDGYWQAIPLMKHTIEIAGFNVIPWLVYVHGDMPAHPGDCGDPRPTHHADNSWSHAPALIRIVTYMNNHPDESEALAEMLPERHVAPGFYRRVLGKAWSGMAVYHQEESI
jgi:hypothetical protein